MTSLPLHELELLRRWVNHGQFAKTLQDLGLTSDLARLKEYVHAVTAAWFLLGRQHLEESEKALSGGLDRAARSRAYYAVYNISKALRFFVKGVVSLKGDDHKAAGDLPSDFPNADSWGRKIAVLYEHRLRADYDNWHDTAASHTLTADECVGYARDFHDAAVPYLAQKAGLNL